MRWLAVVLSAGVMMAPRTSRAQSRDEWPEAAACLAAIPADSLRRVTVYLTAEPSDSTARALLPTVAILTQTVADRMRALLGASPERLPQGEPTITWQDIGSGLSVTAYRDGRITSRLVSDTDHTPSSALLRQAFDTVQAAGEAVFFWPDSARDSLTFELQFSVPLVDRTGKIRLLPMRFGIPAFSIAQPWEEMTHVVRQPAVRYPPYLESEHLEGTVLMQFVVDTIGHAEDSTIHEIWSPSRPRLAGEKGDYYKSLVAAVRKALSDARFEPARIGGCPVRQLVQMPFAFKMDR